ncbi:nucleotidyltransferase family protein [Phenylobacterium kunshanense]|uniref:Nucleotidyltransferase family protein n=1 Tax=Phenylobacterium kunshanense TaxID=1445034 RepID=A0A328BLP3_9CAUL|nr:nucleotidyltransferase family protein [Phenylobacterium kunshanense]RAK67479.1 nucleotidyltransferase family protein [Phenylobacterium kunshanense]
MGTVPAGGEQVAAVVLAAGSARRFGGGKLLAPWRGAPLLHGALAAARAAPVGSVTVVTGAEAEAVAACARAFDPALRIVHAPDHAEGMAASLRAGLASLPREVMVALVLLGDMPRVPQETPPRLIQAVRDGAPAAAPVFGGRRGNPVALSRALFAPAMALSGDTGARGVLQGLGERLAVVDAPDDGVLFDVDERADLDRN